MITIGAKTVNVSVYSFYDLNVHVSEFPSGVLLFIQKLFVASGAHYSERILTLCYNVFTDQSIFRYAREYYFPRNLNSGSRENYAKHETGW